MGVVRNKPAETSGAAVAGIAQGLQEGIAQGEATRQFEYNFDEKANMDRLAIQARMIEIAEGLRNAAQDRQVNARVDIRDQNMQMAGIKYATVDDKRKQDSQQAATDLINRRDNSQRERERESSFSIAMADLYQKAQPKDAADMADRTMGVLSGIGKMWNEMTDDERRLSTYRLAVRNSGGPTVFDALPKQLQQQELLSASRQLAGAPAIPRLVAPTEGAGATSPETNPLGLGIGPFGANMVPDGAPGSLSAAQPRQPDVPVAPGFVATRSPAPMLDYFKANANDINSIGRFDVDKMIEDGNTAQAVVGNAFNEFLTRSAAEAALMHSANQNASPASRQAMVQSRAATFVGSMQKMPGLSQAERAALQVLAETSLVTMYTGYEESDLGIVIPAGINQNPNKDIVSALKTKEAFEGAPPPEVKQIVSPIRPQKYKDQSFGAEPSDPSAPAAPKK
jgi:hypothetical protein